MLTINKYYVDDQEKQNVVSYQLTFIIFILSAQALAHGKYSMTFS